MKLSNLIKNTIEKDKLNIDTAKEDLLFKNYHLSLVYLYLKNKNDFEINTDDRSICDNVWYQHKDKLSLISDNNSFCQKYIEFLKNDYILNEKDVEQLIIGVQNVIKSYDGTPVIDLPLEKISMLKSVYNWLLENKQTTRFPELKPFVKTKADCNLFIRSLDQFTDQFSNLSNRLSATEIIQRTINAHTFDLWRSRLL